VDRIRLTDTMKHSDLTNVFLTTEMKIAVVKVSGLDTYSTAYIIVLTNFYTLNMS